MPPAARKTSPGDQSGLTDVSLMLEIGKLMAGQEAQKTATEHLTEAVTRLTDIVGDNHEESCAHRRRTDNRLDNLEAVEASPVYVAEPWKKPIGVLLFEVLMAALKAVAIAMLATIFMYGLMANARAVPGASTNAPSSAKP